MAQAGAPNLQTIAPKLNRHRTGEPNNRNDFNSAIRIHVFMQNREKYEKYGFSS